MEPEDTPAGVVSQEVTDQSRLANLLQKERMEEINRSLPLPTTQQKELRTTIPLKTPHKYTHTHSEQLNLNIPKTELISTTKPITPSAFSISIIINIHLHTQAKILDVILISFPYL